MKPDTPHEYEPVGLEHFERHFGHLTELSSHALGSTVISVSDQWFASAHSLLNTNAPQTFPGQFGPNGALYDGWESRRHNPTYDWVIIRLGVSQSIINGFDIDTTHFNGNEAPACRVFGLPALNSSDPETDPSSDNPLWEELLPIVPLGPSSRHLFKIHQSSTPYRYLKLHMIPDGGIARFRVYGRPIPVFPSDPTTRFDMASVLLGAQVVVTSNQHYGVGSNLILPGRGPANMDGGWETRRSRIPGHSDHVIIKLCTTGYLDYTEVDTNYFIGNFPQLVDFYGTESDQVVPGEDVKWTQILCKTALGPHQQQYFQFTAPHIPLTHVKMTIYPDGGVKRVRLVGRRSPIPAPPAILPPPQVQDTLSPVHLCICPSKPSINVPILPLTRSSFEPFGTTIEAYEDIRSWPPSIKHKTVNFNTAEKFNHVSNLKALRTPNGMLPVANLCVFRCKVWEAFEEGRSWRLKGLERHPFSSQSFVPLGKSSLPGHCRYLVVVAKDDGKGKPDLDSVRAFVVHDGRQGISYNPNVWHAPLIVIDQPMDFGCLVHETGVDEFDCELVECEQEVSCELVVIDEAK